MTTHTGSTAEKLRQAIEKAMQSGPINPAVDPILAAWLISAQSQLARLDSAALGGGS